MKEKKNVKHLAISFNKVYFVMTTELYNSVFLFLLAKTVKPFSMIASLFKRNGTKENKKEQENNKMNRHSDEVNSIIFERAFQFIHTFCSFNYYFPVNTLWCVIH